ncbi:MAG: hypothetical protein JWQ98_1914 [Chlorobi bacterium]|nr:hypothetical protein [Chlorobiota bacterium]
MDRIKEYRSLAASILLLLLLVGGAMAVSINHNDGHLIYALDDPYIHMSMAKNFVRHGVLGVTPYGFSSSSSSPLWLSILIGVYTVFGVGELAPMILNVLAAIALLGIVHAVLRRLGLEEWSIAAVLISVIVFFPLPTIIFLGLEHIVHACLSVAALYLAARALSADAGDTKGSRALTWLLVLTPLLAAIRYEGALLAGMIALLLLLRRRYLPAFLVPILAALPIVIYGLISRSHGWLFFPNPILLKGNLPSLGSFGGIVRFFRDGFYLQLIHNSHMQVLLLLLACGAVATLRRGAGVWSREVMMIAIATGTVMLHLQFAGIGWFHRYEAYLIAMALVALAPLVRELLAGISARSGVAVRLAGVFMLIIGALPFLHRGLKVMVTPRATANIYQQQYQMGLFLARYYPGASVAANDIGAITFLGDIHLLDTWGLGSLEPALMKRAGTYTIDTVARLCASRGVKLAIVYDSWLRELGGMPPSWTRVGMWTIPQNVVCGDSTVSFYAVDPSERDSLVQRLRAFAPSLPGEVRQEGEYRPGRE